MVEETRVVSALEEALLDEFPWLSRVEREKTGLVEELILVYLDGSRMSVPLLGGIPAPEDPESPFGQAVLRAWRRARAKEEG
jgi:hypothetical protein